MSDVKEPSVAGSFYPALKEDLLSQLLEFAQNNKRDYEAFSRAIVVPHAGYPYSGQLASEGFQYLDPELKNIFIFAPAHRETVSTLAISSFKKWTTPMGEIEVQQDINKELSDKFDCEFIDSAFEYEHAIEVQLPFIQLNYTKVKIIPILVGNANVELVKSIIDYYWDSRINGFVISSDLSHFFKSDEAEKIDSITAQMIELGEFNDFHPQQACGSRAICALGSFAKENDFSLIRIGLYNSSKTSGDVNRVVGYGSWLLYEGTRGEFIKKQFPHLVLDICYKSIESGINREKINIQNEFKFIPDVFNELGASFVTLEIGGTLRGCIGSIIAHRPFVLDLAENAHNAAFSDPRFSPLTIEELEELDVSVSILSQPQKMVFNDEKELMEQIVPFEDGIIIKDGIYQAVYLPSVWEQLPEKNLFMTSLKQKAGLLPDHFSKKFEAYKFRTEYIKS